MENTKWRVAAVTIMLVIITVVLTRFADEDPTAPSTVIAKPLALNLLTASIVDQTSGVTALVPDIHPLTIMSEEVTPAHSLALIVQRHQQVLQFPPYSRPIIDGNSPYLHWNHFEEVSVPVLDGQHSAALSLKQYRYFYPDEIEVGLKTSLEVVTASLDIEDVINQKTLATLPIDNNVWRIRPDNAWPEELRLVARISFIEGDDIISADLRIYHSVASVVSVGVGIPDNTDMVVPLTLQIDKSGIYRVTSNLYQSDGSAIASLLFKQPLSEGEQTIELKAFHSLLPKREVDYTLSDIVIERMSGFPGEKAQYGKDSKERYYIGTFDGRLLSNEPYQASDREKQQLEFLQQAFN